MIRKFVDEDSDAVVAVWRAANELAHPFLKAAFLDKEAEALRDVYLPATETWVTEVDGQVVGFIALAGDEIGGLFLEPSFHGRGLGRAMVEKAVAERGKLSVVVFRDNAIGRRFYAAFGFRGDEEGFHEASGQATLRVTFTPD